MFGEHGRPSRSIEDRGYPPEPRLLCRTCNAELIATAEHALGGNLPPTYREFVTKLGAGNFGAFEIYGVIDDEFEDSSVPNGVWITLNERRQSGLPDELAIVGSTGDGDYYCIELSKSEERPILVYQPALPPDQQRGEQVAQTFGEFLLKGVRAELLPCSPR